MATHHPMPKPTLTAPTPYFSRLPHRPRVPLRVLLSTVPEPRRPVLRLAGDADDAGLEPHICRGID
ncbi:hypothetical protein C7821_103218 [Streptomyces sp. VMFN-G11Ma]|jgi:hypothetical protein|nr:hypothetical protein C7821_103218 [Streptomyces sp. VMFN-G11Ma]